MTVGRNGFAWLLAVILAAIHFIVIGGGILAGDFEGDGALGFVIWDWPLFALCAHSVLGRYLCSFTPHGLVVYVAAGTLLYAFVGFVIGALIDRIRAVIAPHRGRG